MSRLVWTETLDGWQCGRYQIELAAPFLWVLSRRQKREERQGLATWEVVHTAGSLRELKRLAGDMERRRERRRNLLIHVALMIFLVGLAVMAAVLNWGLIVPAVLSLFVIALRLLVIWIDGTIGNPWTVLSEHCQ
ncbi:MAG: hypothetical protein ACRDWS_15435 [Acidimicrobiia bacterium]